MTARVLGRMGLGLATLPMALAWLPLGLEETATSDGAASSHLVSLVAVEGAGVLLVFLVPAVIAALPLLFPEPLAHKVRVGSAVGLGIGVLLGAMTIGIFYLPALGLLIAAAVVGRPPAPPRPATPPPSGD